MNNADQPILTQILVTQADAGRAGDAMAIASERRQEIAAIGRDQGAQALLICPAPEVEGDELDLIIAARFGGGYDEDAVFWRQHAIAREIYHALRLETLVLDLDGPLDFLRHIEPILASPYRDQLGRKCPDNAATGL